MQYRMRNAVRPLLMTRKSELIEYMSQINKSWFECPSNQDTKHLRNMIRYEVMPAFLKINTGLHKTLKRKIQERERDSLS